MTQHQDHDDIMEKCNECDDRFITRDTLRLHLKTKHDLGSESLPPPVNQKIQCPHCLADSANIPSFRKHMTLKHSNKPKHSFACPECDRTYSSESQLALHTRSIHSKGTVAVNCPTCNGVFKNAQSLRVHKRQKHPNKNSKTCPICGSKFANEANLNSHTKQFHSKETPEANLSSQETSNFRCLNCNKTFESKDK
eukprot:Platyproteum_vivax@DN12463_c0_g1_i1.p1